MQGRAFPGKSGSSSRVVALSYPLPSGLLPGSLVAGRVGKGQPGSFMVRVLWSLPGGEVPLGSPGVLTPSPT